VIAPHHFFIFKAFIIHAAFQWPMDIIPAFSIHYGRLVVVEDGEYILLNDATGTETDPVELAKELRVDHERAFVLDIDGLERNSPDLEMINKLSAFVDVWLDAGTLTHGGATDLLIAGASVVVMGTKSILNLDELEDAFELSENILFSLDYDGGVLSANSDMMAMGTRRLLEEVRNIGVNKAMLFDLGGIKNKQTPDLGVMQMVVDVFDEAYVAGFIRPDDIEHLENIGLKSVIMDFRSVKEHVGRT